MRSLLWILVVILSVAAVNVQAQLFYPAKGDVHSAYAAQLWYTGYWKHPGWINGTMVKMSAADRQGKIVVFENIGAPYDTYLMRAVHAGARAVVILRDRNDEPGQGMYQLKIRSPEKQINIPVVEISQRFNLDTSVHQNWGSGSMDVALWPQENKWKTVNEKTAFQVTFNVILSAMELAIIGLAIMRLYAWWALTDVGLKAIAPICIILETVSAAIRLSATIVDPFMSFRTMPSPFAELLVTVSLPFQFSSGILLTFFWAETLSTNQIKAAPFISHYKKSALFVVALLFVGEIVTSTTVLSVTITSGFSPVYISQAFYVIVALVLTICYFVCAFQITRRMSSGGHRKRFIRSLTLRFLVSTSGYMMFIILVICFIPYFGNPLGFKVICNLMFFSNNFTGIVQVYSFRPPKTSYSSQSDDKGRSSSRHSSKSGTTRYRRPGSGSSIVRGSSEAITRTESSISRNSSSTSQDKDQIDAEKSAEALLRVEKAEEEEEEEMPAIKGKDSVSDLQVASSSSSDDSS